MKVAVCGRSLKLSARELRPDRLEHRGGRRMVLIGVAVTNASHVGSSRLAGETARADLPLFRSAGRPLAGPLPSIRVDD